ncbi:hypothetical protein FRZ40_03475 [Paraburkholderia azotifigens]|uniref:Uncharacterized protein n=1 Tax=Paraburkholderia azotifigens TaxID=2057004 RepID=A0A5C6VNE7_9BURK|nr:hypothetical protein FRZ40_03475 [Paraburkholderia azotifigens]
MATGIVKRFDDAKGFGFLTPDGDKEDLLAGVRLHQLSEDGNTGAVFTYARRED